MGNRLLGRGCSGGVTWGCASKLAGGSFSLHPRLTAGIASQFDGAGPVITSVRQRGTGNIGGAND